jgi:plastocyanin
MKKRITFVLALGAVATGLFAAGTPAAPAAARVVTVKMMDYHFAILKGSAPLKHGVPIVFKTVNKGQVIHNFDIEGVKRSTVIGPGKTASITVIFKKAGRFSAVCDVPRHAELGMHATLVVK